MVGRVVANTHDPAELCLHSWTRDCDPSCWPQCIQLAVTPPSTTKSPTQVCLGYMPMAMEGPKSLLLPKGMARLKGIEPTRWLTMIQVPMVAPLMRILPSSLQIFFAVIVPLF